MRSTYKHILKEYLHDKIIEDRKSNSLVQEAMAERLGMSWRSYANIESGKNMVSTLTFVIYLLNFHSSPDSMLEEIRVLFEKVADDEY